MRNLIVKLTIILFCQLALINGIAQNYYKIEKQDSLALVAFYWATDGPNWKSNQDGFNRESLSSDFQSSYNGGFSKWLQGPVKDWYGISVKKLPINNSTDSAYRVTELATVLGRRSEGENFLKGYIPKEIGYLTELITFKVNGNTHLAGTELPDEVYLPKLKYFDVEGCALTGDISDAMRKCSALQEINLRYNSFSYMPALDFIPESTLRKSWIRYWFYSSNMPLSIFEKTVEYFYSVSPTPKEFWIEFRDNTNVGDELEIVAPLGTAVEMVCNEAGTKEEFITYQWFRNGNSRIGKTKRNYSISSVQATDYGKYKVKITNEYVKTYDQNSNWGEVFTKEISLVPEPVSPVVQWAKTSYNGQEVILRMSKPMPQNTIGFEKFKVKVGDKTFNVINAHTSGRLKKDLILTLSEYIKPEQQVSISLTDEGFKDKNGGILQVFSDTIVQNLVRTEPEFVSAKTSNDGAFIEVTFNNYIDPELLGGNIFQVSGVREYAVSQIVLKEGILDENISKTIRLKLDTPIENPEENLTLRYVSGRLSGLFGGSVVAFENKNIENTVVVEKGNVQLSFFDGSGKLQNILISGSWSINPIQLFDDGTNGDTLANDKVWSRNIALVDDMYSWDVISRKSSIRRDTIKTTDQITGIETITVIPTVENNDSIINVFTNLNFVMDNKKAVGDTVFAINDKTIVFKLSLSNGSGMVCLMGIDDDWAIGNLMSFDGNMYVDTLTGYTVGDIINYNYRSDNIWENVTPVSRKYIVKKGENIVMDQFGVFTSKEIATVNSIEIFYDHTAQNLVLKGDLQEGYLTVFNLSGQIEFNSKVTLSGMKCISLNRLKKGIYLVKLHSNSDYARTAGVKIFKNQ